MIPHDTEIRIKDAARANILEVILEFVDLKKAGRNWKGLSPFKQEKTPSFVVNPSMGIFKCFATGIGGDSIKFLRETQGMDYPEALTHLANKFAIEIVHAETTKQERAAAAQRKRLLEVNALAATHFQNMLEVCGNTYFAERGLSRSTGAKYMLGFASAIQDALETFMLAEGAPYAELIESGLLRRTTTDKHYSFFRNRAMFPIQDLFGNVVGFGGRVIDELEASSKYINSAESLVYQKSEVLYGLHQAKQSIRNQDQVILTEGYMDVLGLHEQGIHNVVASCGTALTVDQIRLLRRFTTRVLVAYDGDTAGVSAALKALPLLLQEGMQVRFVTFPEGQDPDDYARAHGTVATRTFLTEETQDWQHFLLSHREVSDPAQQADIAREMIGMIELLPFDLDRELHGRAAAQLMGIDQHHFGVTPGEAVEVVAPQADDTPIDVPRTWAKYEEYIQLTGLDMCPDFEAASDGGITIHYYQLDGKPIDIATKGTKLPVPCVWTTTSSGLPPHEVYLPPGIREWFARSEREPLKGVPLFLTEDPITAAILDQLGIFCIGLARRDGFLASKKSKRQHKTIKAAMALGFTTVVYIAQGEMFRLPAPRNGAIRNAYAQQDASATARAYLKTLQALKECFLDSNIMVMHPKLNFPFIDYSEDRWLDRIILDVLSLPLTSGEVWTTVIENNKPKTKHVNEKAYVVGELLDELKSIPNTAHDSAFFKSYSIGEMSRQGLQRILLIDDCQRFKDFHIEKLGTEFQFGKHLYRVDEEGDVVQDNVSYDRLSVIERDGRYWAVTAKGENPITNFTLQALLKIVNDQSVRILCSLHPSEHEQFDILLDEKLLLSTDDFYLAVLRKGEMTFKADKKQWREIQELCFGNLPTALLVESLGEQTFTGTQGKVSVYVMGNGIYTHENTFIPADSRGLVEYKGLSLFLPAAATAITSFNVDKRYGLHTRLIHEASDVTMVEWVLKYFQVHSRNSHSLFAYFISTLFRDIIYKKKRRFPSLFLQGETGTGKTTMMESISKVFGEVSWIGLESSPTTASVPSQAKLLANGPAIYDEYNVFKLIEQGRKELIDMFKGFYDGSGRAKRVDATSDFLVTEPISAGIITAGQEPFYEYDEALNNRFCIVELPTREFNTKLKMELDLMEANGLGHLLAEILSHRAMIETHYQEAHMEIVQKITEGLSGHKVLHRMTENWASVITPIILLIRHVDFPYPFNEEEIVQRAVQRILTHAGKALQEGILGVFWNFIQTRYNKPGWLDDTTAFVMEGKKRELRLRFSQCYDLFVDHIKRKGDKGITLPKSKNLKDKLKGLPAFIGEDNIAMGFKRDIVHGNTRIMMNTTTLGKPRPVYDKAFVMRFDLSKLDFDLSAINVSEELFEVSPAREN